MSQLFPVAGSKLYIGNRKNAKAAVTIADFTGETWTEIGGWTNAGGTGDTQELVTQTVISEGRNRAAKGTRDGATMENQFLPDGSDAGQTKFKTAIDDCKPYSFKVEWGANCSRESVVTVTIATPGVFTWADHGLVVNQPISFATTGALPTGLTAGTTYYVQSVPTADTFTVSATPGGSAITTSGSQSGVHTATAGELGTTELFFGYAMAGNRNGGDANTAQLRTWPIKIDTNIVEV